MNNINILDPNLGQTHPTLVPWVQGMRSAGYTPDQIQIYFRQQIQQQMQQQGRVQQMSQHPQQMQQHHVQQTQQTQRIQNVGS